MFIHVCVFIHGCLCNVSMCVINLNHFGVCVYACMYVYIYIHMYAVYMYVCNLLIAEGDAEKF